MVRYVYMSSQTFPEATGGPTAPDLQPFLNDIHDRLNGPEGFWQQLRHWDPDNTNFHDEPWAPIRFSLGSHAENGVHVALHGPEKDLLLAVLCEELQVNVIPAIGKHLDGGGYDRVYVGERAGRPFYLIETYRLNIDSEAHVETVSIKARPPASLQPPPAANSTS
jgi:hypothetical protein